MEKAIEKAVPFLTRFFRAWADDIKLPDKELPKNLPKKPSEE